MRASGMIFFPKLLDLLFSNEYKIPIRNDDVRQKGPAPRFLCLFPDRPIHETEFLSVKNQAWSVKTDPEKIHSTINI